jgi:hypothetical protein
MKEIYYCSLFILVALLVHVFLKKVERLTTQEVDDKQKTADDRITVLEDEFKKLHNSIEKQTNTIEAATAQANEAQALLHSND